MSGSFLPQKKHNRKTLFLIHSLQDSKFSAALALTFFVAAMKTAYR